MKIVRDGITLARLATMAEAMFGSLVKAVVDAEDRLTRERIGSIVGRLVQA